MRNLDIKDSMILSLNSINKVKNFSKIISVFEDKHVALDLSSGRYLIDAMSILGIFSLDLSKPVELHIHADSIELVDEIKLALSDFIPKQ